MNSDLINKANTTVLGMAPLIGSMDSEEIKAMIHEFNLAESSSVIFDAVHMKKPGGFYGEQGGDNFWESVKFKKKFLELLLPLVEFGEKTKKEMFS